MNNVHATRYNGQPWLRLLDAYVLWSIGALDQSTTAQLERLAPKLQETFKAPGARWFEIVEAQMKFTESMPATLSSSWEKQGRMAAKRNQRIDPVDFAHRTVDANFRR